MWILVSSQRQYSPTYSVPQSTHCFWCREMIPWTEKVNCKIHLRIKYTFLVILLHLKCIKYGKREYHMLVCFILLMATKEG